MEDEALFQPLDEDRFWNIIDTSRRQAQALPRSPGVDFFDLHEAALTEALRRLSPAELIAFHERFLEYRRLAYRWDLWAAAYWLGGGCGDDGFMDFRSCLISLGRELYFRILENPDNLVETVDRDDIPYMQSEGFQYLPGKVYKELTGEEIPFRPSGYGAEEPSGERLPDFDDAEEMGRHFPRLVARLPEMGD